MCYAVSLGSPKAAGDLLKPLFEPGLAETVQNVIEVSRISPSSLKHTSGKFQVHVHPLKLGKRYPGSDGGLPFPILRDPRCEVAAGYRIAVTASQQFWAAYRALGCTNSAKNGSNRWVLPIPATYLLDSTGLVVFSYLDADYATRLESSEIIVALSHLRTPSITARDNR